jgi:hypothetical protein
VAARFNLVGDVFEVVRVMSSDYLNYELSKELHDLGVEFEARAYRNITTLFTPEEYKKLLSLSQVGIEPYFTVAPSTAQVIDKLRELGGWGRFLFNSQGYAVRTSQTDTTKFTCLDDYQCATTCLGEALVKLKRGEKE